MSFYKKILFGFFVVLLFVPLIQMNIHVFKLNSLKGAFILTEKPDSISKKWFSEEYQQQYDKYFNDHLGFRNILVRTHNQINFSFFNKISPINTAVGKDNVLYQFNYIDSYLGLDYVGEDIIKLEIEKVKYVQDELLKINKKFLYVVVPGKASLYPDFFPDKYDTISKKTSNYDTYNAYLKKMNISYLDLIEVLRNIKDTSRFELFPKNGTHWNAYSVALSSDTLSKHITKLMHKKTVDIKLKKGRLEYGKIGFSDNDIGDALNLVFELPMWDTYTPKIEFNKKNAHKIKSLIVGDSFTMGFYRFEKYFKNIFSAESRYFYYYRNVQWPYLKNRKGRNVDKKNTGELIKNQDLIMIVTTDQNLKKHGFGLIDDLYSYFKNTSIVLHKKEQIKVVNRIKSDKAWLENIKKEAIKQKVSVDDMLIRAANYLIEKRKDNANN